jgi:hypothetical protein
LPSTGTTISGGAPGDLRRDLRGFERRQSRNSRRRFEACANSDRALPLIGSWRERAAAQVFDRRVVGGDHPQCAALDRHVADGHSAFHRQGADRAAGEPIA